MFALRTLLHMRPLPARLTNTAFVALLVLLAAAPADASAQKCKFSVDKKDPLTGEHLRAEGIQLGRGVRIGIGKAGQVPQLSITLTYPHDQGFQVQPGNLLIVKLASGDTLHYRNVNTAAPVTYVASTNPPAIHTQYTLNYFMDQRFYPLLAQHPPELFRVHLGDRAVDVEVNSKDGRKIMKYADCLR